MEYFTFPMETLNVTQTYLGKVSHYPHTTGTPKDYPIDIAGIDEKQSAIFARVPLRVVAKRGIGNSKVTNTVWLETVDKVITPTFTDVAWMTLTHFNDGDTAMQKWNVDSVIPKGSIICYEGKDGASANHIHLVCGKGKCSNWVESTTGKWVMDGDSLPPEQVLYIDDNFTTTIKNTGNLKWLYLPKYIGIPVIRDHKINQLEVLVSKLNVREDHDTSAKSLGYINLGIYDYTETYQDQNYTWYHILEGWIADDGSWLIIYPKEDDSNCEQEMIILKNKIQLLETDITSLQTSLSEKEENITVLEEQLANCDNNQSSNLKTFKPSTTGYYYLQLDEEETLLYTIISEK